MSNGNPPTLLQLALADKKALIDSSQMGETLKSVDGSIVLAYTIRKNVKDLGTLLDCLRTVGNCTSYISSKLSAVRISIGIIKIKKNRAERMYRSLVFKYIRENANQLKPYRGEKEREGVARENIPDHIIQGFELYEDLYDKTFSFLSSLTSSYKEMRDMREDILLELGITKTRILMGEIRLSPEAAEVVSEMNKQDQTFSQTATNGQPIAKPPIEGDSISI